MITPWARNGFAALDPDKRGPFLSGFIQQQPHRPRWGLFIPVRGYGMVARIEQIKPQPRRGCGPVERVETVFDDRVRWATLFHPSPRPSATPLMEGGFSSNGLKRFLTIQVIMSLTLRRFTLSQVKLTCPKFFGQSTSSQ